MSADDNIEIEFPSFKQTAPDLVKRAEVGRDPGPIEAQLSKSSETDDLSWLTAIFDDEDEDQAPEDAVEAVPVDPADNLSAEELDPRIPPPPTSIVQSGDKSAEASSPLEDPANLEGDEIETDFPELASQPSALASLDDTTAKKATGFREEIMSTFSQMYN